MQAELAGAIVNAIVPAAKGSPVESAVAPTTDLNAYDLYLAAKGQLVLRTPESIRKSVELSEQAVRLDPNFARGQAQLAQLAAVPGACTRTRRARNRRTRCCAAPRPRSTRRSHSIRTCPRRTARTPTCCATTGRPGAEEQYKRALELNPNNAATWHDYAVFLGNSPDRNAGVEPGDGTRLELDPRQPVTWANYLGNLGHARDPRFRAEFDRAIRMVGDMPFAIDRFTLPALSTPGFPVEVMKAATIKQRSPNVDNLPLWVNRFRAWLAVDPERATAEPASMRQTTFVSAAWTWKAFACFSTRTLQESSATGPESIAISDNCGRVRWPNKARVASVAAFWHAVQGRYDEAAAELEQAGPIVDSWTPPVMGGDAYYGQMETAQLRIQRATGRAGAAESLVAELLSKLRAERKEVGTGCLLRGRTYDMWMRHASLAANEGYKDEAVDALAGAQRCGDLPPGFLPQLPWFKALDGYPPIRSAEARAGGAHRENPRRAAPDRNRVRPRDRAAGFAVPGRIRLGFSHIRQ